MTRSEDNSKRIGRLLEEFARQHYAGEAPDPLAFVREAGEEGERMRELIALFLAESEPVLPTPATARDLVERYSSREGAAVADEGSEPEWSQALRALIDRWASASTQVREALADRLLGSPSLGLRLEPSGHRGVDLGGGSSSSTVIQLNRRQGGKAEVEDGVLVIVLYDMPEEFAGTQPLLAFPNAGEPEAAEIEWAGTTAGLPPGLACTDTPIGERRELRATIGRVSEIGSLELVLTGLRVLRDSEDAA